MCQCPLTGNHHFYGGNHGRAEKKTGLVSMPSNGQPSFLLYMPKEEKIWQKRCQCPLTGNHHFYGYSMYCVYKDIPVSMPSNGQPSFLPGNKFHGRHILPVSMPSNGQPSFLRIHSETRMIRARCVCQCPLTGNHHFYRVNSVPDLPDELGVNAL